MKFLRFFSVGILFGIVMTKSEAVSWFRIQEMFRFESFHMYGLMGTAVVVGAIGVAIIKSKAWKSVDHQPMDLQDKERTVARYLLGGTIFGLGWAMTGACPGPLYVLLGNGIGVVIVVLLFAVIGAFFYGVLRKYLPH